MTVLLGYGRSAKLFFGGRPFGPSFAFFISSNKRILQRAQTGLPS